MAVALNALTALAAAASWGGGDFSGGMGVKAAGGTTTAALRIVVAAHALSLAVLLGVLACIGGPWPHGVALAWALTAGATAAFSLTAFYVALSRGDMGPSAAISGLLAAAIPAIVSSLLEGAPRPLQFAGFALAAVAIWLIAASPAKPGQADIQARSTILLATFGGIGFGLYFVALKMANGLGVLEPMAISRIVSLTLCLAMLGVANFRHRPAQNGDVVPSASSSGTQRGRLPGLGRAALWGALGVAVLDTGGNLLFLAATRLGRLDVAAVLASLYPAGTILLAAWRLHERPSRQQWLGMSIALAAVVLIVL